MCLFKTDDTSAPYRGIINLGACVQARSGFSIHTNSGYLRFDTGNYTYLYDPKEKFVADNRWHFVCASYDKSNISLYLDNELIFSTNAYLNTLNPILVLGEINQGGGNYFIGDISDVRVYNRGLNANEINEIYKEIKK